MSGTPEASGGFQHRLASVWAAGPYVLLDVLIWMVTIAVLTIARYDLTVSRVNQTGLLIAIAIAAAGHLLGFAVLRRRYRYASSDEMIALGLVAGLITAVLVVGSAVTHPRLLPLSVALAGPAVALLGMIVARRAFVQMRQRVVPRRPAVRRALVIGAGGGGVEAIRMMLTDVTSELRPVGIVDDDPRKQNWRLSGVRVLGTIDQVHEAARESRADVAVFAIPSASAAEVERAAEQAGAAGLEFKILPSTAEILTNRPMGRDRGAAVPQTSYLRPLLLDDLLGRKEIVTDRGAIGAYLTGRVVLVTGAGGSIGAQLAREIRQFGPRRLVITDHDESALHALQLSLDGQGMLDSTDLVLGDLRSPGFVRRLIADTAPDVVFHTAALKSLILAERFPEEAYLTNVGATALLVEACAAQGVERLVHVSTYKACDPRSVLGLTKRIAERLTATAAASGDGSLRYVSVRLGNVLGSRGSAFTAFAAQLEAGLPLTITARGTRRFFMAARDACQLLLQAGAIGNPGEALVLDMGEPYDVEALARRFAAINGHPDPKIVYTHLRTGERLVEERLGRNEPDNRPVHPLITHVTVPPLDPSRFPEVLQLSTELVAERPYPEMVERLRQLAGDGLGEVDTRGTQ